MTTTVRPPATPPTVPRPLVTRWWLWAAALGAVVIIALVLVLATPVLGVSAVDIRGNRLLTAAQVRSAASIAPGSPLLRLDRSRIARRVESLPEVASAAVTVSYPSTVTITVHERVAVGYVQAGDPASGPVGLIDATGTRFRTVAGPPAGLPRFMLPDGPTATPTGRAVAAVAGSLPSAVLSRLSAVQALDAGTITLLLTDGRVVLWGTATQDAEKARVLPALLGQPGNQFDLTDPDAPVVR